jgi:hypothetical protein
MKYLLPLLLFSSRLLANQCLDLFHPGYQYYENYDREYNIVISPTSEDLRLIEPNSYGLLLDEKIKPGDKVFVSFVAPLDPKKPSSTKETMGYLLGTRFLTNDKGHLNLHYYILTESRGHLISFTQSMINFEGSHLVKRKYGQTLH